MLMGFLYGALCNVLNIIKQRMTRPLLRGLVL